MNRTREVERNERAAAAARAQLAATLAEIQQRLAPDTLARNAWDTVRERGREIAGDTVEVARRRPLATGAILSAIALFLARGLIWRGACRIWQRACATRAIKAAADPVSAGDSGKEHQP